MQRGAPWLLALTMFLLAPAAYAQGVVMDVKTHPMVDSETLVIPIAIHNTVGNPPHLGWAGAIIKFHLLDNSELDIDAFHTAYPFTTHAPASTRSGPFPASVPFVNPIGTRSNNLESVPLSLTLITPNWANSGQNVTASINKFLGSIQIHAKGTTPANNSDVDATLMFWNIWHVRQGFSSLVTTLFPSDRIFVGNNPLDPTGDWIHITNTQTFHLGGGSTIFATFLNTATLGVEHVPEPASGVLIAGGLLALAAGSRVRRHRMRGA